MDEKTTPPATKTGSFSHEITVRWADCDPARIAYTGRLPYFALEAIEAWWDAHIGLDWYRINIDRDVGTPFVHLSLDFRSPVTPRHKLICRVTMTKLGQTSVRFRVEGYQNDVLCFEGDFVEAFVSAKELTKISIPDDIRQTLEALQRA